MSVVVKIAWSGAECSVCAQTSVFNEVLPLKVYRSASVTCARALWQPCADFLKLPVWLWAHLVIQVLTITQRFGHEDTGYFHIPDGCYFNYTELLDFELWIYMFFLLLWMQWGLLGRLFCCIESLFLLRPLVSGEMWGSMGIHNKRPCLWKSFVSESKIINISLVFF